MRKVAVFFGGKSCENEISVLTGVFVLNVLDRTKFSPVPIYIHTDGGAYTAPNMTDIQTFKEKKYSSFTRVFLDGGVLYALGKRGKVKRLTKLDIALNCCHGGLGEGGGVSAIAEWNGIPLASPALTASGVFLDKCTTKTVLRALGVPFVDYLRVNERDYRKRGAFLLKSVASRLKYPVVVKPAHLGSSIGIRVAKNEDELRGALENAFTLDYRAIVEKYLTDKKDVNCAAYCHGGEIVVSEPEEAFGAGLYSFEEKYIKRTDPKMRSGGRCALSGDLRDKIRAYTRTVYKRMDMRGVVRMDFLVSKDKAYLCEVNTVPGSLAYYLFCERVSDARAFFTDLLEEAVAQAKEEEKSIVYTGILSTAQPRKK